MEYFLRQLVHGDKKFLNIPLDKKVTVIGEDCFPGLKGYHNLSLRHAKFTRKDIDQWYVEDIGSHHGTFVNGKSIDPGGETVSVGDQIGFGVRFLKRGLVCSVSAKEIPIKQEPESVCDPSGIKTENGLDEPPRKIFKCEIPDQPIEKVPPAKIIKLEVPNLLTQQIFADKTTKNKLSDEIIPQENSQRGGLKPQNDYQSVQSQYAGNSIENNSKSLLVMNENINTTANYSYDDDVMVVSHVDDEYCGYSRKEEVIVISDDEFDAISSKVNVIDETLLEIFRGIDFSNLLPRSNQSNQNCSNGTVCNASGDHSDNLPESNNSLLDEEIKHSSPHSENANDSDFNNDDSNSSVSSHDEIYYPTCVKRKESDVFHNGQEFLNKSDKLSEKCGQETKIDVSKNKISNNKLHDAAKNKKTNDKQLQNRVKNSNDKRFNIIQTSRNDNDNLQGITKKGNDNLQGITKKGNNLQGITKKGNNLQGITKKGNNELDVVKKNVGSVAKNIKTPPMTSLAPQKTTNTQNVSKLKGHPKKVKLFNKKSSYGENIVIKESPKERNSLASYKIPKKSSSSQESNDKYSKKTPIVCKQSASRSEFLLSHTPITGNLPKKNVSIKNAAVVTGQNLKSNVKGKNKNNKLPSSSSASPSKKPTPIDKPKPLVQSLNQIKKDASQSNDSAVKGLANITSKATTSKSQLSTHSICVSSSKTNIKSSCTISSPVKSENLAKDHFKFPGKLPNNDQECHSQSRHMQKLPTSNTPVLADSSHNTFDYSMSQYVDNPNIASTSSQPTMAEVYKRQLCHKQLEATKKPLRIDYNHKTDNRTSDSSMKTEQYQKQLVSNVNKSIEVNNQHRSSMEDKTSITSMTNELSPKQQETATVKPYIKDYHHKSTMDNRTFNNPITSEVQHRQLETAIKKPLSINYPHNLQCVDDISVSGSITSSAMQFQQQQTEIPVYETNPFSKESVIQRIVEFNYLWLKEQQSMSSPPPLVSKGVKKLPLHFNSFNEYAFFFLPMFMLEMWETLHQEAKILWMEPQMCANVFLFTIESCESTVPMTKFHCGALIEADSFPPMKGNVVLMHITDLAEKHCHTILGYIDWHCIQEGKRQLIQFSVLVKARNFQPKCKVIFKANGICSVTKYLNLLGALRKLDTSSLRENVLVPNSDAFSIAYSSREPLCDPHNKSVIEGISKVIEESTSSPKVVLLQGLYGAVKTGIIVSLLEKLIHTKGSNFKVLVTAPSNGAIEEIGRTLIQLNEHHDEQLVKFVLIDHPDEVFEELRTFTLDHFYNEQIQIKVDLDNIKIELNDLYNQKRSTFITERIQRLKDRRCDLRKKLILRNNTGAVYMSDLLWNYSIVLAPLNRCYRSDLISRSKFRTDKNLFSCCIVDEATHCTELELLQAASDTRKLILVGDPQESAIVLSMVARKNGYGRSMFGRFQEFKIARRQ